MIAFKSEIYKCHRYIDFESLPEELKYSENNPFGIMEIKRQLDLRCKICGKPFINHVIFNHNGKERIICPGLFILYEGNTIIDILDEKELNRRYKVEEVIDYECNAEKGIYERAREKGRTS